MRQLRTEKDIDDLRRDVVGFATLLAWSQAGQWELLAAGPRPLRDLPGDTRALELTAPILANMGLLLREGDTWAMTTTALKLHELGCLRLGTGADMLAPLSRLDEVLRHGGPVKDAEGKPMVTEGGVREHDRERTRVFLDMLYRRSEEDAHEVARRLAPRLPQGAHVLDLGGGHGRYARVLADRGLRATLFDRPLCLDLARERHGDRLSYHAGNFLEDPLGGPYDAILISNIVHGLGPDENRGLLASVRRALAPRGLALVKDMFLDALSFRPDEAAAFGASMLMYTRQGRSYSLDEMRDMARAAGLATESHTYLPDRGYSLVVLTPAP